MTTNQSAKTLPWPEAVKIVENIKRPEIKDGDFYIDDYGSDLQEDILPAVKAAIEKAAQSGGGRVIVPAGYWRCNGPIHLQSGIEIHFSEGAFVKFGTDPSLYLPNVYSRWEGVNLYNYSPVIYGYRLSDVAITGKGIIDGGAEIWSSFRAEQGPDKEIQRSAAEEGVPVSERQFGEGHYLRPSMLHLLECEKVLIQDVTLTNSSFWMIHPVYCKHVTLQNTTCDSMFINNDGCDIDSCSEVLIDSCTFRNGDDGIAMKAGRDKDAWDTGIATRNVVVRNCEIPEALHGFAIGSEMSGGVENIYVHNCSIGNITAEAIQFKSNKDRGGVIKNIHVSDITVKSAGAHFLFFTNDYHSYRGGEAPTEFTDFDLQNITCEYAVNAIHLQGLEEKPLTNIKMKNISVKKADLWTMLQLMEKAYEIQNTSYNYDFIFVFSFYSCGCKGCRYFCKKYGSAARSENTCLGLGRKGRRSYRVICRSGIKGNA
ncbi:MAG: glycoside hydrolase family 28 protein [Planctomycetota bacterium]